MTAELHSEILYDVLCNDQLCFSMLLHRSIRNLLPSFIYICYCMREFYIHGSVHRDSILIRSNEMQQCAGVYLLQNYSTCFGCLSHISSGVHQTVTAASGTGHSVRATTFRLRCCISLDLINICISVCLIFLSVRNRLGGSESILNPLSYL